WAWAAVILGAYLLYTRLRPSSSAAPSGDATAAAPSDSTSGSDSGAQVPASGGGGAADNLPAGLLDTLNANTASLDALTSQVLSQPTPYSNFGDSPMAGIPAEDFGQSTG